MRLVEIFIELLKTFAIRNVLRFIKKKIIINGDSLLLKIGNINELYEFGSNFELITF